jgi:hypothetical protein
MKITLVCTMILVLALGLAAAWGLAAEEAGSALEPKASETMPQSAQDLLAERRVVTSEREDRQFRIKWWAAHLAEDMKDVYDDYGYPSSRYREETMGRLIERWTYVKEGRSFTFRDGQLVETRRFAPGTFKGDISRAVRP